MVITVFRKGEWQMSLIQQIAYHKWATLKVVQHLEQLPSSLYHQAIISVFPSINHTCEHMIKADEVWLSRLQDKEARTFSNSTPKILRENYEVVLNDLVTFIENEKTENRVITYKSFDGKTFSNTVEEIIQHIVNHGTYHRGNISAMLRQLNNRSVPTDYLYFLRR